MSKFQLPETLPVTVAELDALAKQFRAEIHDFQRKAQHTEADVEAVEGLVAAYMTIRAERDAVALPGRLAAALAASASAVAPKPKPPTISLELAVHEAAHAVVAAIYDAQITDAVAWPEPRTVNGGQVHGMCTFGPHGVMAKQHSHMIDAAGAVGAGVLKHGPDVTAAQINRLLATGKGMPGSDYENLAKYRRQSMVAAVMVGGPREVLPVVLKAWPAISKVALRIQEGEPVQHEHVVAALGLSDDVSRHPFELANIRAGMRKVPA